jgi:hypothetical protein
VSSPWLPVMRPPFALTAMVPSVSAESLTVASLTVMNSEWPAAILPSASVTFTPLDDHGSKALHGRVAEPA